MKTLLLVVFIITAACLLADAAEWTGDWLDKDTNTVFTVLMEGDDPTVVAAVDLDNNDSYDIVRSAWDGAALSWTIFIASSSVTLTYNGHGVTADSMDTTWENNWEKGEESLVRYDFSGVWGDESIGVWTTIERMNDSYIVTRVEDRDDGVDYQVTAQNRQCDSLHWEFYIPATGVTLGYTVLQREGDNLVCAWNNSLGGSGEETLTLDGVSNAEPIAAADLQGVWFDASINTYFFVHLIDEIPVVSFVYDDDESMPYDVTEQSYTDGVLEWSIHISVSDTDLTYSTTHLEDTRLHTDWWNNGGSKGEDYLQRVENPYLDVEQLIGDWTDTDINARFRIVRSHGRPAVDDGWDIDIDEAIPVTDSEWYSDGLMWTVYIGESDTHITYWADALVDEGLACTWSNGYSWGVEFLQRGDDAQMNEDPLAGVWRGDGVEYEFERRDDAYMVVSIVDTSDGERFPILEQSWADDTLTFSYFAPSTGYSVQITVTEVDGDTLSYEWRNDESQGSSIMVR